jgi:Uma2 family endonuclease
MNVQLDLLMDKPAFLAWVEGREERYELAEGRLMMMTGGSRGHALVTRRLAAALEKRLDGNRWAVLTSDFGVDLGPSTVRYPDVLVDVTGGSLADLTASAPILVAEVISPSSAGHDLGEKPPEYFRLQSLSVYLVLAQDEARAWVWLRGALGFPTEPDVLRGLGEVIRLTPLGIEVPLSEIYTGVESR